MPACASASMKGPDKSDKISKNKSPASSPPKPGTLSSELKNHNAAEKCKIDVDLVRKAVSALIAHHNSETKSTNLLGNDTIVQVQLGLEISPQYALTKPTRISIPHSFRRIVNDEKNETLAEGASNLLDDAEVCLIVKDEAKPWIQEMISNFPDHMGCIKKVLTLDSLRKKHARFQQRRELLRKYTLFLADDRILPMLPAALGKEFFKTKKFPIPIRLTRKEALPYSIQKALGATFMTVPKGTCITIVVGKTDMPIEHLVENVLAVASTAPENVPRKWVNVRSMMIKTPDSTALPFYNKTPEELKELAELAGAKPVWKPMNEIPQKKRKDHEGTEGESAHKKKKDEKKSPLLKALEKQKRVSKDANGKTEATTNTKTQTKSRQENSNTEKHEKVRTNMVADEEKGKSVKKRKSSDASGGLDSPKKIVDSHSTNSDCKEKKKTKSKIKEDEAFIAHDQERTVTKKSKNEKMKTKDDSSTGLDKTNHDSNKKPTSISATEMTKGVKTSGKDKFIPAKKFEGSKDGYVFKRDTLGLGYYADVKPVVGKMAIEALLRASKERKRSPKRLSSGKGSKRRSR